jgi:hypothetical protein
MPQQLVQEALAVVVRPLGMRIVLVLGPHQFTHEIKGKKKRGHCRAATHRVSLRTGPMVDAWPVLSVKIRKICVPVAVQIFSSICRR